jgi:hypothetical protein
MVGTAVKSAINLKVSRYAQRYIRDKATELMPGTCRFYAPPNTDDPGNYNPTTGDWSSGAITVKWTGPCRIWEVAAGQQVVVGEQEIVTTQTYLSLPFDVTPLPEHDDIIEVLTYPDDPDLVGRTVSIEDFVRGGGLRASRRFLVTVQSSNKSTW